MNTITNRTFDEISVGDRCERHHTVTEQDLILFAAVSGDHNPLHLDAAYAATTQFKGQIAHGMFTGALISAALATVMPGPGTIYLEQSLSFKRPVKLDDTLTVTLSVLRKEPKNRVSFGCDVRNQNGDQVVTGEAKVIAPTEKISLQKPRLPKITIES